MTDTGSIFRIKGRRGWAGEMTVGYKPNGKPKRPRVYGRTKADVQDKFAAMRRAHGIGVALDIDYTVSHAIDDYMAYRGYTGDKNSWLAKTTRQGLGYYTVAPYSRRPLRPQHVRAWLDSLELSRSSLSNLRSFADQVVRHACATQRAEYNPVSFVDTPKGRIGRPSKSFTVAQARAVINASRGTDMHAYILAGITTGIRTEEARVLQWSDIDLESDTPHLRVWRSVRAHGDTKTPDSRRTVSMPQVLIPALEWHREAHGGDGPYVWGGDAPLSAHVVRKRFRAVVSAAGLDGTEWAPRELRHTCVSILSDAGVPIDDISQILGHKGANTTKTVYRHKIRPVVAHGTDIMDSILQ